MKKNNKNGFTLIELIMVMIILGILAAVAIPRYLETIEKVLPGIDKIIIPDTESGNMLNLLNLNPNQIKGEK